MPKRWHNAETFDPYYVESLDQVTYDIDRGQALAAWVIPAGFQAKLVNAGAERPQLQLIVDGADVSAAQTAAEAAGWDADRTRAETAAYVAAVRRHYQIQIAAPKAHRTAA